MNKHSIVKFNLLTPLLSILNHESEKETSFILAEYFIKNFACLHKLSIYKVSEECFVSRSSIQRFVKQIGYDSFTSLKESIHEISLHQESFIRYTDHANFDEYLTQAIHDMTIDISDIYNNSHIDRLISKIYDSRQVVLLTAEDSSSSIRIFQQAMLAIGKLVRIITSASISHTLLEKLNKNDLLIVCSVTGNYALAIDREIKQLHTVKSLITLNYTAMLEDTYDHIYYLSSKNSYSNHTIVSYRDIYTNYGMTYFLDLLYHGYFKKYHLQIIDYGKKLKNEQY